MKPSRLVAWMLTICLATRMVGAVPIGYYPGLATLIDTADAIVILRIDRHLSEFNNPTLYSTHECYIYQCLKGDIEENATIKLQLMNTEGDFATPYAHGSTHLMFLMKKVTPDEPTEYRTLTFKGAQTLLSPLGHEKEPRGHTLEQKVKAVIRDAIAYQEQKHQEKRRHLQSMIGEQAPATPSAERTRELSFTARVDKTLPPESVVQARLHFDADVKNGAPRLLLGSLAFKFERVDEVGQVSSIMYPIQSIDRDRFDYSGDRPAEFNILTPDEPGKYRLTITLHANAKQVKSYVARARMSDPGPWWSGRVVKEIMVTVVRETIKAQR